MQPGSVYIEIQSRQCVQSVLDVARAIGLKVFETMSATTDWKSQKVDLELMMGIIERGYQFLKEY
jgi:hypothetical protein